MSYDTQTIILSVALLVNTLLTFITWREIQRLKRMERVFDEDDEDYGVGIE